MQVVIDPHVPVARWQTLEDVQRNADRLNAAAAQAAELGLKVGYHNHDHELATTIDGTPVLEVFAGLLDPAVLLEVDLYWATAGGVDPVAPARTLGDRVVAVHVKDGPMRPGITSRQMPKDQAPAGQGDVPLAAALEAGDERAVRGRSSSTTTRATSSPASGESYAWLRKTLEK